MYQLENFMDDKGYTEYGYRGLEELRQLEKRKDEIIIGLEQQVSLLKMKIQELENRCNDLQAKASVPRY